MPSGRRDLICNISCADNGASTCGGRGTLSVYNIIDATTVPKTPELETTTVATTSKTPGKETTTVATTSTTPRKETTTVATTSTTPGKETTTVVTTSTTPNLETITVATTSKTPGKETTTVATTSTTPKLETITVATTSTTPGKETTTVATTSTTPGKETTTVATTSTTPGKETTTVATTSTTPGKETTTVATTSTTPGKETTTVATTSTTPGKETTTVATTSTTTRKETTTVATTSTTPKLETITVATSSTINPTRGLDQHTAVLIVLVLLVVIICVLLICLPLLLCRFSRNRHRKSLRIMQVDSNAGAPVVKVKAQYVKDEKKPERGAGEKTKQCMVKKTAADKDYESLKDKPHVYSHLRQSLNVKNEITAIAEVYSNANSKSMEKMALQKDDNAFEHGSMTTTVKRASSSKSQSNYVDMSGTDPKYLNKKMERQHHDEYSSKPIYHDKVFTGVQNMNWSYDDDDYIDRDNDYVDMTAVSPKYNFVESKRKKRRQVGSFYTDIKLHRKQMKKK
ncbi:hypothetical protein ACF0H5_014492 [Mactra antiquata]